MRPLFFSVALTLVVIPSSAAAQSLMLTEAEALSRLSPDSPRARAIRAAVEIARADVGAFARWPYPRIVYDRESVAGVTEHIATIGQTLAITGRRGLEVNAANALVDASEKRAADELRRARADLRLAFAQLTAAQTRERELTGALERLAQLAALLGRREAAGDASGFDRLRAEREVHDLEADRALAATERARAQAVLAGFLVEVRDPSQIVAVEAAAIRTNIPPVDALVEHAEAIRGDLQALGDELDAARLSARAAQRRLIPEPEIIAGSKSSTIGGGGLGGVVGVQATLPLFGTRPEQALAAGRAARAQAQIDAFRIALRSDIASWRTAVVERRDGAARYRAALDSSTQVERIAQVSYDAGERGILELLDAYRSGLAARIRQTALDASVRQAEIELEFVSGWEIP
jgi:outer membrane protein, heavy metal efflux system